jgi:cytochrome c oxidase subunit IV
MSDHSEPHSHSPAEVAKHVRVYLVIFAALLVATVVTVALYAVHFESVAVTIVVALLVATVKAALVACYFMHLISEKRLIYIMLGFTMFFFAGLMVLTLLSYADLPTGTVTR